MPETHHLLTAGSSGNYAPRMYALDEHGRHIAPMLGRDRAGSTFASWPGVPARRAAGGCRRRDPALMFYTEPAEASSSVPPARARATRRSAGYSW